MKDSCFHGFSFKSKTHFYLFSTIIKYKIILKFMLSYFVVILPMRDHYLLQTKDPLEENLAFKHCKILIVVFLKRTFLITIIEYLFNLNN